MTSLAATLAHLRDHETLPQRVRQFDAAIALATRIERELAEAMRALAVLHDEEREEAELAEREAQARRAGYRAREAAIEAASGGGTIIRFPRGRAGRCEAASKPGLGAA